MPARSKAQFKKMALLYRQGKISKKTFEEFDIKGLFNKLPERVGGAGRKEARSVSRKSK